MVTQEKNCVIDCRVSDPQQLKGGSLNDQEELGRRTADRLGARVLKVFRKPHSATTTEREDFQEIIDYIKLMLSRGIPIHYYIIKSIDRLTREGYPEYVQLKAQLEKLGVQAIDAYGTIQPNQNTLSHLGGDFKYKWSIYSPSEAGEMLASHEGKQEVRNILTRMIGAEIRLVQEGYAVRRAPDGLTNKRVFVEGKEKVIRELHPDRGIYFQKMFELRAEGVADEEIVTRLNATGFRTKVHRRWDRSDKEHPRIVGQKGGVLLTVKQLQRYILQTEYAGVIYEKWTHHQPIRAKYEGIVSIEQFNRANRGKRYIKENSDGSVEVLHNYSPWGKVKRLKNNPEYPHKWVLCPHPSCKCEVLGSGSTNGKTNKKYGAYHCGGAKKGKRDHISFRVPKDEFEKIVRAYLEGLKFEEGFLAGLELHLIDQYRECEKEIVLESSAISRSVAELKAEQAKKLESFGLAESPVTRRKLEEQITDLDIQIQVAESERGKIEVTEKSIKAFIRYARYAMEHPAELLENADDLQSRRALVSLFFEETPTYSQIVNGTPKLQPIFTLSEEFKRDKTQLVTPRGIEPRFTP